MKPRPQYTYQEYLDLRRAILWRMLLYSALGAALSWLFAQLALHLMAPWNFDRAWVGRIAVAIVVLVPFFGSVASFGLWWWNPYPFVRMWRKCVRTFTRTA